MSARPRFVPAVARQRLEGLDHVAVRLRKAVRLRQRTGARDLVQHLALARARHLERVEVLGDLRVAFREQLQPLDRVVDLLAKLFLRLPRLGGYGTVGGTAPGP